MTRSKTFRRAMMADQAKKRSLPGFLSRPWPYAWLFLGALVLVVVRSLTVLSRSPDDFNFGGEWDALITAREYATHSLADTHLLSYIASYDAAKQHVDVWRYTHYPIFQYIPAIILARYFGAHYSAQLELGNVVYLILFAFFLYAIFRCDLTEKGAALCALLILCLAYKGYWQAILGSLGTPYTLEIVLAPLLVYAVVRKGFVWLVVGFTLLCLDTYDAYIPCVLCLVALGVHLKRRTYVVLGLAIPLLSLAIRLSTNLSYYHDPQVVAGDLLNAFGQRSAGCTLDSVQTTENVKNYGGTPSCSLGARLAKHAGRLIAGMKQLPSDCLTSYRYGTILFLYGLIRALVSLARSFRRRAPSAYGPIFVVSYSAGTALFGILLPESMLLGGWTFNDLMPVTIWGMATLYQDLRPWWERIPAGIWIPRLVLLAALLMIVRRTGVPAALSDREVDRFTAVRIACDSTRLIRTNLEYHYFAYLCGTEGYKLVYAEKKPGEPSFVVIPGFRPLSLGDVQIRGRLEPQSGQ